MGNAVFQKGTGPMVTLLREGWRWAQVRPWTYESLRRRGPLGLGLAGRTFSFVAGSGFAGFDSGGPKTPSLLEGAGPSLGLGMGASMIALRAMSSMAF